MATKITGTNTAAAPGVTGDDADTGLFYGTNEIGFSTGGTSRATVDSSGNLNIPNDSGKIRLGTGNDLEIYHDGTDSYIKNNAGALILRDDVIKLKAFSTTDTYLEATNGGGVSLRWDNSTKFETTSAGCTLTGALTLTGGLGMAASKYIHGTSGIDFYGDSGDAGSKLVTLVDGGFKIKDSNKINFGSSDDLQIYHDGTNSILDNNTGDLIVRCDSDDVKILAEDDIVLRDNDDSTNFIHCINGGAVELYYNGTKKFETTSNGADVTGRLTTDGVFIGDGGDNDTSLSIGANNDLRLYHDGSNSYIKDRGTGVLAIAGSQIDFYNAACTETMIQAYQNGAVKLRYDNSIKLETTSSGITVTGTTNSTSDIKLKENIKTIENSLDKVLQLRGVEFDWKESKEHSIGVIAQEVEEVLPDLVHETNDIKGVSYGNLTAVLIEAIKEQNEIINNMKKEIEALKNN